MYISQQLFCPFAFFLLFLFPSEIFSSNLLGTETKRSSSSSNINASVIDPLIATLNKISLSLPDRFKHLNTLSSTKSLVTVAMPVLQGKVVPVTESKVIMQRWLIEMKDWVSKLAEKLKHSATLNAVAFLSKRKELVQSLHATFTQVHAELKFELILEPAQGHVMHLLEILTETSFAYGLIDFKTALGQLNSLCKSMEALGVDSLAYNSVYPGPRLFGTMLLDRFYGNMAKLKREIKSLMSSLTGNEIEQVIHDSEPALIVRNLRWAVLRAYNNRNVWNVVDNKISDSSALIKEDFIESFLIKLMTCHVSAFLTSPDAVGLNPETKCTLLQSLVVAFMHSHPGYPCFIFGGYYDDTKIHAVTLELSTETDGFLIRIFNSMQDPYGICPKLTSSTEDPVKDPHGQDFIMPDVCIHVKELDISELMRKCAFFNTYLVPDSDVVQLYGYSCKEHEIELKKPTQEQVIRQQKADTCVMGCLWAALYAEGTPGRILATVSRIELIKGLIQGFELGCIEISKYSSSPDGRIALPPSFKLEFNAEKLKLLQELAKKSRQQFLPSIPHLEYIRFAYLWTLILSESILELKDIINDEDEAKERRAILENIFEKYGWKDKFGSKGTFEELTHQLILEPVEPRFRKSKQSDFTSIQIETVCNPESSKFSAHQCMSMALKIMNEKADLRTEDVKENLDPRHLTLAFCLSKWTDVHWNLLEASVGYVFTHSFWDSPASNTKLLESSSAFKRIFENIFASSEIKETKGEKLPLNPKSKAFSQSLPRLELEAITEFNTRAVEIKSAMLTRSPFMPQGFSKDIKSIDHSVKFLKYLSLDKGARKAKIDSIIEAINLIRCILKEKRQEEHTSVRQFLNSIKANEKDIKMTDPLVAYLKILPLSDLSELQVYLSSSTQGLFFE